ncbi:helix-turn-helix transcriptional regulator [Actinomadura madurae]|uniref:helix-turn-helix transcriptional regulator n=1 Tax=Actinomadura madurae TaxID=1993 RepID=UPI000D9D0E96|nr:LuxR family transcriptional regulator [Actinomadura madurae]SPT58362.1 response regulator [Actinomadura madurae]
MLQGRAAECAEIERLVAGARAGAGGAAVIRGEQGIGKSALLDHAAGLADGALVLRCSGYRPEAEQPFAALDLMLRPVRDLGGPDAERLRAVSESGGAGREDVFTARRAVLSLLRRAGAGRPVLCLVDDAQWLDAASADALVYAARRFGAEPVALLAAARDDATFGSSGLAEIRPARLGPDDAAALLRALLPPPARDRVRAEADGNPAALRLLASCLSSGQRAGRINPFTFHDGTSPLGGTVQAEAGARLAALPPAARTLLLVAAADDTRDAARITAAAGRLGSTVADLAPAERAGLLETTGLTIGFAHPLVKAVAYHHATTSERRAVHRALADSAGDGEPELRAWHLAAAAVGHRAYVAAELERAGEWSGDRRAHICYARAAELTADGRTRAHRLAAAARAASQAGLLDGAADLVARAAPLAADPLTRAELAQAEAAVEFERGSPRRAARTLIDGAAPIRGRDPAEAALMLAEAVRCGWHAGDPRLVREAAGALRAVPLPAGPVPAELPRVVDAAVSAARGTRAPAGPRPPLPHEPDRRLAASLIPFTDSCETVSRFARDCRDVPGRLPYALQALARALIGRGRHREARAAAEEGLRLAGEAGARYRAAHLSCLLGWLAAVEGDEGRCAALVAEGLEHARAEGIAPTVSLGTWALALLDLGAGRHAGALARLEELPEDAPEGGPVASLARQAADRAEAAVRSGRPERAEPPLARLEGWARRTSFPGIRGLAARCRALLADPATAERHFADAVELFRRNEANVYERARTELLYGEWLRRTRRRAEAGRHLGLALKTFEELGARAWGERAKAELFATGARTAERPEKDGGLGRLTHQELQIVRLAAAGASNREIAARLFLSPRTVGNHLYRAYPKLGVRTRVELRRLDLGAAAGTGSAGPPVEQPGRPG